MTQTFEVEQKPIITNTDGMKFVETISPVNIEYPYSYFDAQVRFAVKWSELSGESVLECLKTKTALYRRITSGKPPHRAELWNAMIASIPVELAVASISHQIYSTYLEQEHSIYTVPSYPENDGKHFGCFSFDYLPAQAESGEKARIKIHFLNRKRGEKSSLDADYLLERKNDLKKMFEHIKTNHPDANEVVGGSWLYTLQSYRDTFPPQFLLDMKRLVPKGFEYIPDSVPTLSYGGNSVWGQFVDRKGGTRQPAYGEFITKIDQAQTLEDLVNAFPNFSYQPRAAISVFYDWIAFTEI